jgi:hypothetical protein
MDSNDLKLFALFYIKEHEDLSDKDKVKFMNFVEGANDEDVLFLLYTGQMPGNKILQIKEADGDAFRIEESASAEITSQVATQAVDTLPNLVKVAYHTGKAGLDVRSILKKAREEKEGGSHEKPWGPSTIALGATAASSLAMAASHKIMKRRLDSLSAQCEKEKGMARKVCYNKIRKDSIRAEILSLSSMKIKCRKTKNPETCIKNIDARIEELQTKMNSIKVF